MCKLIWCLVAVAYALTASLTASVAVAWTPDYAPWVLLTGAFNGSVKGVGFMPGPGPSGTAFVYGDTGGLYRSDDCGDHWDYARGGAPVSDGRRGGYRARALPMHRDFSELRRPSVFACQLPRWRPSSARTFGCATTSTSGA